ncbi:hypothetical protein QQY66_30145 [Streptomyces sp. DG2A-72]|uniref:hypothetical protein n=1 Tax=Streptomyces sp. DG2A-72 TaxID=3051386 RepID=UPI00265BF345|nr:hypothetical protein [Streptomyces sp. DG2A-72]MDO0935734.1 hypothetical protein [Streptomyces sp. DG2A-72]
MPACGCINPIDIMVTWAGYGLLGIAGLFVGLVCLAGLLLGGMTGAGHVMRRWRGDDDVPGEGDTDGERLGLASFRWESEPD